MEYIEHLPLETDKKAMKVLRLCEVLDMLPQGKNVLVSSLTAGSSLR